MGFDTAVAPDRQRARGEIQLCYPLLNSRYSMRYVTVLVLLALALCACQDPVEPDLKVAGVQILVRVVDQGNTGVRNVQVRYADRLGGEQSSFGTTNEKGEVSATIQVPIAGADYWFDVFERTPSGPDTAIVTGQHFHIGCLDAQYVIPVVRTVEVACDSSWRFDDEMLSTTLCTGTSEICSRRISFNCDNVKVEITRSNDVQGAIFTLKPGNTPIPSGSTTVVNLAKAGDACSVCMSYTAQSGKVSATSNISIEAASAGNPKARVFDISFTGITSCDSCACPTVSAIRYPAADRSDTLCWDTTATIQVPMGALVNTNQNCDLGTQLMRGPIDADVKVLSLNGVPSSQWGTIAPTRQCGPLVVSVRPSTAGKEINDEVLIVARTQNRSGMTSICDTIRVGLHFVIRPMVCPLILGGDLIASQSPLTTNAIRTIVCSDKQVSLNIKNPSPYCPIQLTDISISGADASLFRVDPSDAAELTPGATRTFSVHFYPTYAAYIANKPPRDVYNATLTIRSECGTTVLPLTGIVQSPSAVPARLFTYNCPVDSNTAFVVIDLDGTVGVNQQAGGATVLTVQSATITPTRSAVLQFAYPCIKVKGVTVNPLQPFCDLRDNDTVRSDCKGLHVGGPGKSVTVREGDLLLTSYPYHGCPFCALIWVEQIDPAGPTRPCPQVQFRVCSPIVL